MKGDGVTGMCQCCGKHRLILVRGCWVCTACDAVGQWHGDKVT